MISPTIAQINVCPTCEMKSLTDAVKMAEPYDVIVLGEGTYLEHGIIVDKPLSIVGKSTSVIDGEGETIMHIIHDSVMVSGIRFQHVETNYVEDRAAVKCSNADYLVLENLVIDNSFFGLLLERCKYGRISECYITGDCESNNYLESANGNAIHLWYCDSVEILNNELRNHRDGIYLEFVEHSLIHQNVSEGNMRYGLHFMFSHNNTYTRNQFVKNGAGVAVMYSSHVIMEENWFSDNWSESSYGLLLKDISDSELRRNTFEQNTIAISADNSSRLAVENNRFIKNGYALRIMGNCEDGVFRHNDFISNSFDITTNSNTSLNSFDNNYWSEYAGYDLDRDGYGDTPFRPVKLFTNIIAQSPASIILMRSMFIDLLNLAEKVTPVLTPENLIDQKPLMNPANDKLRFSN